MFYIERFPTWGFGFAVWWLGVELIFGPWEIVWNRGR